MSFLSIEHIKELLPDITNLESLYLLVGGSPGLIREYEKFGAIDLYKLFLKSFENFNFDKLKSIIDQVSGKGNNETWKMACFLIDNIINKIIKVSSGLSLKEEIIKGENGILNRIASKRQTSDWEVLYDRVKSLLDDADRANLDRKQVLIIIFEQFI